MYELILTMQRTPYGMRIGGPDPDRAVYLPTRNGSSKPYVRWEHIWQSPELDIFVFPATDGVEIKIKIYGTKSPPTSAAAKAA